MGNGSTRAAKSIPTQHQGKGGLSGRAGGAWRGAQDAVIFGTNSGTPQTNAGHRRPTRDRPFRIELPHATIRGFTQSGAVTEVGVAWNAARPANGRAARRGLGPGAVLRPGRAGCFPRPGLTGEQAGRFAPPAQTRPGHHFSVCRPKGEPQRLAGNVHRLFVNTLSLPYLGRMGRNQGQAQSSLALFQNAGLNKKNQAPPSENSLDPCGADTAQDSTLDLGPSRLSRHLGPCSVFGVAAAAAAKSLQSCPTLCDLVDGSPPGSSVHGIFQARILEWGAIAFSDPGMRTG